MQVLRARLACWWHCLTHFGHRSVTFTDRRVLAIGCDCGQVFYLRACEYNLRGLFLDYLRDVRARRME